MSRFDSFLIQTAEVWSRASRCKRSKVGCVIARDSRIIATGFNGTLPGEDNCCEEHGGTKPTVMHAEQNALMFCAKHGLSTNGCSMYTTVSPCIDCAKMIVTAGISKVVYSEEYRDLNGLKLLEQFGIEINKLEANDD